MIATLILAFGAIAGCSSHGEKVYILLRHNAPPEQPQHRALVLVAEKIRERSNGRIVLDVQPNVNVPNELDLILAGSMEIGMGRHGGSGDLLSSARGIRSALHVSAISTIFTIRSKALSAGKNSPSSNAGPGFTSSMSGTRGSRQVTLRDRPATTPLEFGHIRLRIPGTVMYVEMAKVLGALPTTMNFSNVHIALRTGVIDGQENPLPTIKAMRFNEVCRYLVLTGHMIGTISPVIGEKQWEGLSPADRALITQAFREGARLQPANHRG